MGVVGGQSPDFFAWHKWQLGWINDYEVECVPSVGKTTHRISPIEVMGENQENTKALAIPVTNNVYIMAEVRSNLGIDDDACGTGVLLYTADNGLRSGEGPIRVIDTTPDSQGCAARSGGEAHEFNDAPLSVGKSWDTGYGVIVTVTGQEGDDYLVEVERQT